MPCPVFMPPLAHAVLCPAARSTPFLCRRSRCPSFFDRRTSPWTYTRGATASMFSKCFLRGFYFRQECRNTTIPSLYFEVPPQYQRFISLSRFLRGCAACRGRDRDIARSIRQAPEAAICKEWGAMLCPRAEVTKCFCPRRDLRRRFAYPHPKLLLRRFACPMRAKHRLRL